MTKDTGQCNEATDDAQNKQSGRLPEETHGFRVLGITAFFHFYCFSFDVGCSSANAMLGFRQGMWLLEISEQRSVCKLFIFICFSLD